MIKNTENGNEKVVVLFEVTSTAEGKVRYLELAARLKPLLSDAKGFIRSERFGSLNEEGKLLSLNVWENEEAVKKWRNELHHRMNQSEGRERLFESYRITVASVVREYDDSNRNEAPADSNKYFRNKQADDRL
ncbi:antibiotic biosynthesis monooxygenase [uncultured Odoribacter sp.]|uniref:antibiotic biosynthesis monooxygenase family protein n=1 Tax=uncultured Odoribacter sp. TaxID=876416 RepID=UPI00260E08F8|nr:antibiotic biosynthesis monooxygenase [uncultured Odoribacter sp.]